MNRCRTSLELFFAIWFVIGNVWVFDSPFGSFHYAPNLHVLCITLLAWNALCYSFPFLLFLLLCCVVPLISSFLGYNMNMGSSEKGASDDQISSLPSWKYKVITSDSDSANDPVSSSSFIVRKQALYGSAYLYNCKNIVNIEIFGFNVMGFLAGVLHMFGKVQR